MNNKLISVSFFALFIGFAAQSFAGGTKSFVITMQKDFAAGQLEGTSVNSHDELTRGASLKRHDVGAALAFSACAWKSGVLIGTGHEGKVFFFNGSKAVEIGNTGELMVSACAVDGDTAYIGTLPKGKIFRLKNGGKPELFATLPDTEQIWAMEWDKKRKSLFAATGPNGKLFQLKSGKISTFFDAEAEHIMAVRRQGSDLLIGTNGKAQILRLRKANQAEVVAELPGTEITAIAVDGKQIAAVANTFSQTHSAKSFTKMIAKGKKSGAMQKPRPGKGKLFLIGGEGQELLFEESKMHFTDVVFDKDRSLLVSGGDQGRVFRVERSGAHALWADVDERQVLNVVQTSKGKFLATGDSAAIYAVASGKGGKAIWTSKVLDVGAKARFGELTFRAKGKIQLQTRSGNVADADETWTDWSTPIASHGPVRSPAARFLQVRATLLSADSALHHVEVYYLAHNQRAYLSSVKVNDQGKKRPSSTYSISWQVKNPDKDKLRYRLRYRAEGQPLWREMFDEEHVLTANKYNWDTTSLPDGHYIVEVEASDEVSNSDSRATKSKMRSKPVLVDNHAPRIVELKTKGGMVVGRATDDVGPIDRLEVAFDGGEWTLIDSKDEIMDTANESFAVPLPEKKPQVVAIRATDRAGNEASRELVLRWK